MQGKPTKRESRLTVTKTGKDNALLYGGQGEREGVSNRELCSKR